MARTRMIGVKHANDVQVISDDDDESEDDIAPHKTSTPQPPPRSKLQSSTKTTTAKPKTKQAPKRNPTPLDERSDDQDVMVDQAAQALSDDDRDRRKPGPSSSSKNTVKPSSKPSANGKRKATAPSSATVKRKAVEPEEPADESSEEIVESPLPKRARVGNNSSSSAAAHPVSKSNSKAFAKLQAEVVQLREEVAALQQERDTFASQFDALAKLRQTDAEKELIELRNLTDARAQTQDALIETLTGEIANMKELARDGHIHGIKLLTTEARDAKLQDLEAKLRDKDEALFEQTSVAKQLTERVQDLEADLQQEREYLAQERARVNTRRHMSSSPSRPLTSRSAAPSAASTDALNKLGLYEDLTNIIIQSVKTQRSAEKVEITKYSCLYTVNQRDSLPFEITIFPPSPGTDEDEVMYNPLLNENQPLHPEFKEKLSFLAHGFTFIRSQTPSFLKTLIENFMGKTQGEEEGEEEEEEDEEEEEGQGVDEGEVEV